MDLSWRPVRLAVELRAAGADFVVVGGTAAQLTGSSHRARDLDVVTDDPASLVEALTSLGIRSDLRGLERGCVRVRTPLGDLDVHPGPTPRSALVAAVGLQVAT